MKQLNVLVAGINYPPEHTGIAPYTGAMADALHAQGFGVDVLTAHPHYPEWRIAEGYGQWRSQEAINGVKVTRLRHFVPRNTQGLERAVSEISFGLRQVFSRWHRPDVVLAVSPALLSSALVVAKASALRIPTVVWVQDLYGVGAAETGGGIAFFGGNEVDQVVGVAGQRGAVGLGGADVHVTEDLRRIDADQFDRKAVGERHGHRGLARGSRAHEQDGGRQAWRQRSRGWG